MNSLKSFFTSPRGMRLVNLLFFLTAILGSSLLAIAACGLWLVYLAAALCQRPAADIAFLRRHFRKR